MQRKKLTELLNELDKKVKISEKRLKENKLSADLTSKTAGTSWSAAGEREYTAGQLTINKKAFEQISILQKEISEAVDLSVPEVVMVPCFATIKTGGTVNEIYIVKNVANMDKFNLVSSESIIGKALLGKKVGEVVKTTSDTEVEIVKIG